jgi:hypothetical protein
MSDEILPAPIMPDAFPSEVHESLVALRRLTRTVKSTEEWRAVGRRATEEEIALAETLRKPHHCTAHSQRTGLPCEQKRMRGQMVCNRHGGTAPAAVAAAKRRYLEQMDPTISRIIQLRDQSEHLPTALKAAEHLIERGPLGPLRPHSHDVGKSGVTVNIGFLTDQPKIDLIDVEAMEVESSGADEEVDD